MLIDISLTQMERRWRNAEGKYAIMLLCYYAILCGERAHQDMIMIITYSCGLL